MTTDTPDDAIDTTLWVRAGDDLERLVTSGVLKTQTDLQTYAAAIMRVACHHHVNLRGISPHNPDYYAHVADEIDRMAVMLIDTGKLVRQLGRTPEPTPQ